MKKFSLLPLILILVFVLTSCNSKTKSINVEISCDSEAFSVSGSVELPDTANSAECFRQLCNINDIVIEGVDDGFITSVNGIENEGNYAWIFYINNELAETGTKNHVPEDGTLVSLKCIDWTQLFTE